MPYDKHEEIVQVLKKSEKQLGANNGHMAKILPNGKILIHHAVEDESVEMTPATAKVLMVWLTELFERIPPTIGQG